MRSLLSQLIAGKGNLAANDSGKSPPGQNKDTSVGG